MRTEIKDGSDGMDEWCAWPESPDAFVLCVGDCRITATRKEIEVLGEIIEKLLEDPPLPVEVADRLSTPCSSSAATPEAAAPSWLEALEARLHLIRCNQVEERGRAVEASERLSKRLDALEARVVSIEEKDRAAEWRVPDSCQQMQLNTLQDRITDLEASLETRLQAYERAALTEDRVSEMIEARLAAYQDGIDRVARATDTERVREIVRALLSEDSQPGNATHAVAAAWASIDGKELDPEGGYLEDAEEMVKRLEKRGYRVVRG